MNWRQAKSILSCLSGTKFGKRSSATASADMTSQTGSGSYSTGSKTGVGPAGSNLSLVSDWPRAAVLLRLRVFILERSGDAETDPGIVPAVRARIFQDSCAFELHQKTFADSQAYPQAR